MIITIMDDSYIESIEEVRGFLQSARPKFTIQSREDKYKWIGKVAQRFKYRKLKKKERGIIKRYLSSLTDYSIPQIERLIGKHYQGTLQYCIVTRKRHSFPKVYSSDDITLLARVDIAHGVLNGNATKEILRREYETYGREEYKSVSRISVSHLYNIRNHNSQYQSSEARYFRKTKAAIVNIGERRKPEPNGYPGYLRVDTVHQGDKDGEKSLYHVNIVDEVTQWEMVATVEAISEHFLTPVIEELLHCFPFRILEFHSDNGSEFVNHVVAKLLTKLYIRFTKSRARHSNDNALVESKNGSVIRKLYGHMFIPKQYAEKINKFNREYVNVYLNYHRPCGFAEKITDKNGKTKKKYNQWMTPYEKLKSLQDPGRYLKDNVKFKELDTIASQVSDTEFAENVKEEKNKLFEKISPDSNLSDRKKRRL